MNLFLFTFFVLYGGVHIYTFAKARHALGFGAITGSILALFLCLMVIMPVLVRIAERRGFEYLARVLAYSGYIWMGLLFLFFSAAIAIDLWNLLFFLLGKVSNLDSSAVMLASKAAFFAPLAWALATFIYGYFEAGNINVERVVLSTPKLPPSVKKLTIAQISDVHLGLIVRRERLARVLTLVKAAQPDLLVSTGDLVDGQLNGMAGLAEMLQQINPPYGKFAVTGNHEFYAGMNQSLSFTERAGFRLLRNQSSDIDGIITIAGVDDPAVGWCPPADQAAELLLLNRLPRNRFTLFLKHRPKVEPESVGLFDLQLSGHVHKGQIFPFNLVTYLFYPVHTGLSRYPQNSFLYVSRGTGTWGPPIRFLAPPEVSIIDLVNRP